MRSPGIREVPGEVSPAASGKCAIHARQTTFSQAQDMCSSAHTRGRRLRPHGSHSPKSHQLPLSAESAIVVGHDNLMSRRREQPIPAAQHGLHEIK